MRTLTDEEVVSSRTKVESVLAQNEIEQWEGDMFNPYSFEIKVPVSIGEEKAVETFNDLFHTMGVLPINERLQMGEEGDYCACCIDENGESYSAMFNHQQAMRFKEGDEEYQFTLKAIHERLAAEEAAEEAEMLGLVDGIKAGQLKVKSPDGYLVLAGEFYDAIETGEKTIEYRDFTKYNLKRTIGLTTVRFNRGYGSKGKSPKQMKWEVKKVALVDYGGNECDPFNVPEDFWPTAVAIHLGKRLA